MATEIERKFLVRDDSWRPQASSATVYRQGYLGKTAKSSVRVRVGDGEAKLNIKSAVRGRSRAEFEYGIPLADADFILGELCQAPLVEKTRYAVKHRGHEWEVDVFSGDNEGLVVAEIELDDANEAFERPAWVGEEVTDDVRYYNASLVEHPFKSW